MIAFFTPPLNHPFIHSQELRSKYTRSDLDNLAEEEKQAWLEVVEERKEADEAAAELAAATEGAAVVAEAAAKGAADVIVQEIGVEGEAENVAAGGAGGGESSVATAAPEGNCGVLKDGFRHLRENWL